VGSVCLTKRQSLPVEPAFEQQRPWVGQMGIAGQGLRSKRQAYENGSVSEIPRSFPLFREMAISPPLVLRQIILSSTEQIVLVFGFGV
jgi:hypothetical protein